jgi:DNA polymerase III subunit epsilon
MEIDLAAEQHPIFSQDVETTGLYDFKLPADHPSQPRVAAVAWIPFNAQWVQDGREWVYYVKPDDWFMPPDAFAVNGLSMEFLHDVGRPIREIVEVYHSFLREGRALIGFNTQFEAKAMRGECRRLGLADLFNITPTFCAMRAFAKFVGRPWAKREDALQYFGLEQKGHHDALGDCVDGFNITKSLRAHGHPIIAKVHRARKDHPALVGRNVD